MNFQKKLSIHFLLVLMNTFIIPFTSKGVEIYEIKITNIKKNSGKIIVEIYNNKKDWLKNPYKKIVLETHEDVQKVSLDIPFGKYAITVFQDFNNNEESDMNFLSIPKEPIGFGNNFKPFGEPKFDACSIQFNANSKLEVIKLYEVF